MTALPSTEDLARLSKAITPGPWRVGPVDDTRVEDADGNEVAQIDGDYNQPETWPLMEANAEAIALLPALIREVIDRREAEAWRTPCIAWTVCKVSTARCEIMPFSSTAPGVRGDLALIRAAPCGRILLSEMELPRGVPR